MRERNYNYDLLRIFACILIICMHAPKPASSEYGIFLSSISYFSAIGLCEFFVLSGALLLPVKFGTFEFLKKRLGKVILPTMVFTLLYLILGYINGNEINWIKSILSIPFSPQGHGVLWFMYALIGLYLLSPIISKWLMSASKREVEFYLLLWIITQCYPIITLVADINTSANGILYYFSGYIGYFLLGYYLKTYPESITIKKLIIPTFIAIAAPVICKLMHIEVDFYSMFWYLSIFVAILTVAMYKLFTFKKLSLQKGSFAERLITTTSGLTFGIYLIHIAIMRYWLWKQDFILGISNYYLQTILIIILTFTISWMFTYIISLLPFGDFIIGYKKKKQ